MNNYDATTAYAKTAYEENSSYNVYNAETSNYNDSTAYSLGSSNFLKNAAFL